MSDQATSDCDPVINCAAEVCCADNVPAAESSLAKLWRDHVGPGPFTPEEIAHYTLMYWDLAGRGTLYDYKQWIVTRTKENLPLMGHGLLEKFEQWVVKLYKAGSPKDKAAGA